MDQRSHGEDVLRDAADLASLFDPELEATLRDMAAEYAGPWIDPEDQRVPGPSGRG